MDVADALFSKTRQRLIGVLFGDGALSGLNYAEVLRRTAGGAGAIHRELKRLQAAGLIARRDAGRRLFLPNSRHPIYPELRSIARKLLSTGTHRDEAEHLQRRIALKLAKKYLWWMDPREVVKEEDRLVAQVMNMGTFEDARLVERRLGREHLRRVLRQARPGQFDARAWTYWNHRLDLARPGRVPPMPQRRFG